MMTENFPQINVRHQSPDQEENPRTLSWINKKTLHLGIFWEKKKKTWNGERVNTLRIAEER